VLLSSEKGEERDGVSKKERGRERVTKAHRENGEGRDKETETEISFLSPLLSCPLLPPLSPLLIYNTYMYT